MDIAHIWHESGRGEGAAELLDSIYLVMLLERTLPAALKT